MHIYLVSGQMIGNKIKLFFNLSDIKFFEALFGSLFEELIDVAGAIKITHTSDLSALIIFFKILFGILLHYFVVIKSNLVGYYIALLIKHTCNMLCCLVGK